MDTDSSPLRLSLGPCLDQPTALVLSHDVVLGSRLLRRLGSFGIQTREATSAAGAASILRRADMRKQPIDYLIVDGRFQGICGMSLCAALCVPLRQRPMVLLQAPIEDCLDRATLERSGVHAVIEADFDLGALDQMLQSFRSKQQS
ncbi:MAG: hypothetical protein O3A95_08375 [Planctomycetota bacterium]|nr:hypothetical protein [Planctomycetota bacterium]MDA1114296.1 hypothetical protein [Planctomycetota bacterium]